MSNRTRFLAHAAIIAALYAVLTHLQNLVLPGSATWAIQMRLSEALCVLSFFTPAAIPGLSLGCLLFNLTYSATLPLDFLVGTLATYLACQGMYLSRKITVRRIPLLGLMMPALTNAVLVGWELTVYIGGGFFLNASYVAIGEAIVLLTLGTALYCLLRSRGFAQRFFLKTAKSVKSPALSGKIYRFVNIHMEISLFTAEIVFLRIEVSPAPCYNGFITNEPL